MNRYIRCLLYCHGKKCDQTDRWNPLEICLNSWRLMECLFKNKIIFFFLSSSSSQICHHGMKEPNNIDENVSITWHSSLSLFSHRLYYSFAYFFRGVTLHYFLSRIFVVPSDQEMKSTCNNLQLPIDGLLLLFDFFTQHRRTSTKEW